MSAETTGDSIEGIEEVMRRLELHDPCTGVNEPWHVARYLVETAVKVFRKSGRTPKRLHLPVAVEVILEVDFGRADNVHGRLRDMCKSKLLFGCQVVWDAPEFKVE